MAEDSADGGSLELLIGSTDPVTADTADDGVSSAPPSASTPSVEREATTSAEVITVAATVESAAAPVDQGSSFYAPPPDHISVGHGIESVCFQARRRSTMGGTLYVTLTTLRLNCRVRWTIWRP